MRLHKEDKAIIISFIDSVRLTRSGPSVKLQIFARYIAEKVKVNPDISNARLANKFATLLETSKIK